MDSNDRETILCKQEVKFIRIITRDVQQNDKDVHEFLCPEGPIRQSFNL